MEKEFKKMSLKIPSEEQILECYLQINNTNYQSKIYNIQLCQVSEIRLDEICEDLVPFMKQSLSRSIGCPCLKNKYYKMEGLNGIDVLYAECKRINKEEI